MHCNAFILCGYVLNLIEIRSLTASLVVFAAAVGAHHALPHMFPMGAGFVSAGPRGTAPRARDGGAGWIDVLERVKPSLPLLQIAVTPEGQEQPQCEGNQPEPEGLPADD